MGRCTSLYPKTKRAISSKGLPAGFRLPTEAEWEYAARGGQQSKSYNFAGSNTIDEVAWYDGNSGNKTHPVEQKKPNELDLYDMSGNVWEWCQDWYGSDYYKNSAAKNPLGPANGSSCVLRGGSWRNNAAFCRVADRNRDSALSSATTTTAVFGWRCLPGHRWVTLSPIAFCFPQVFGL